MIHVLATINLKPDTRDAFLQIFNELVPDVLSEDGCIDYFPTVDVKTDLENQPMDAAMDERSTCQTDGCPPFHATEFQQ